MQRDYNDLLCSRETPYYSLELYLHLQLLTSPLRVLTAEEADIVYAPPCKSLLLLSPSVERSSSCLASSG